MQFLQSTANWVWETSLAASVLILIALVVGAFLRKPHFTPIRRMLGLLVVARLLLPFALPSPFSIFNLFTVSQPEPVLAVHIGAQGTTRPAAPLLVEPFVKRPAPVIPIFWAAVAVMILARVFVQHFRIQRSVNGSTPITSGPAFEALESAREIANSSRKIKLYFLPELRSPALFGSFRPAILLPAALATSPNVSQIRMICLHELAHLQRLDVLINWLTIFAQALHWFNPLVWFAMRRLRVEQELLCDRDVMSDLRPEEHRSYGETLLALASSSSQTLSPLIPISSNYKQLKERIAMITHFKPVTRRLVLFVAPPLVATLAVLTFTAAVKQPDGKSSTPPKSATDKSQQGLMILERELAVQTQKLDQLEAEVSALGRDLRIPPYSTEIELYSAANENQKRLEQDKIRAQAEYRQLSDLYNTLKPKSRDALLQMLPTAYRDEHLATLLTKLLSLQQDLASVSVDKSDEHPEVRRLKASLKTVDAQIDERVKGVLAGLETLASTRRKTLEDLEKQAAETANHRANLMSDARPYFRAVRDLETQRRIRESTQLRLLQERVDGKLRPE